MKKYALGFLFSVVTLSVSASVEEEFFQKLIRRQAEGHEVEGADLLMRALASENVGNIQQIVDDGFPVEPRHYAFVSRQKSGQSDQQKIRRCSFVQYFLLKKMSIPARETLGREALEVMSSVEADLRCLGEGHFSFGLLQEQFVKN